MAASIRPPRVDRSDFRRPGARAGEQRENLIAKVSQRRPRAGGLTAEDRHEILAQHPVFSHLTEAELQTVMGFAGTRRVRKNQEIFHRGDEGSQLYAVLSGRVKVTNCSPEGKGIVFGFLDPGDVFGEIAFFDGGARTASVVAVRATELLVIHRRDFLPFLQEHPEVALKLLGGMADRLRATDGVLEDRVFLSLPSRLAKKLLNLSESYGHPDQRGLRIQLKLSQGELGEMVGTSRESVNKQLRAWEDDGLLEIDHGYITLCETASLEEIAGFVLA